MKYFPGAGIFETFVGKRRQIHAKLTILNGNYLEKCQHG
jgi:hypothetical protein